MTRASLRLIPDRPAAGPPSVVRVPLESASVRRLGADAPALEAMTDFSSRKPLTVLPSRHVDAALQDMIIGGVRSLLVVEDGALLGLVTANDLQGERPIQFLQSPLCEAYPCRHANVRVVDVMTPLPALHLLDHATLRHWSVARVMQVLQHESVSHLLVMRTGSDGTSEVCGVFSHTHLVRTVSPPT